MFRKIDKLRHLWDRGKADRSLIRYLPGGSKVSKQKKINIVPKKAYASSTYIDKKDTCEFTVELAANTYTNYSKMTLFVHYILKNQQIKMLMLML